MDFQRDFQVWTYSFPNIHIKSENQQNKLPCKLQAPLKNPGSATFTILGINAGSFEKKG